MKRFRRTAAGPFAVLLVCAAVVVEAAPVAGGKPIPYSADASVFGGWLRYSEQGARGLYGVPVDSDKIRREIARLSDRLRPAVTVAKDGPGAVDAFRRILLDEEGFTYDQAPGNPENYLIGWVLDRKRGNCLGLALLWLSLAERLEIPLRAVYVPGHMFVRYEAGVGAVNSEFSDAGAPWADSRYRWKFHLRAEGPYLRSLSSDETVAVFLKSLGAAYAKKGRNEEALELYDEAERLYPGLPDAPYNAGVSLQRLGRHDQAVSKYRRAVALDPGMAVARGNLAVLLAMQGHHAEAIAEGLRTVELEPSSAAARGNLACTYSACGQYDEAVREFEAAVALDPANAAFRAGLTRALFLKGAYAEAARACDQAMALGCRFEPSLLETLSRYRGPAVPVDAQP